MCNKYMRYSGYQIVFQEIPDEVSLAFQITGCKLNCPGCHSQDSWNINIGIQLNKEIITQFISKYNETISCILFLGGEWHKEEIVDLLSFIKSKNLKTALYTGLELHQISSKIISNLDYIKTGRYDQNLGALNSPLTNQKLYHLPSKKQIYLNKESSNDSSF